MKTSMVRNLIVVTLGALFSFVLIFAGWRFALIVGSSSIAAPMDRLQSVAALFAYAVAPLVFMVVAAAVASIVSRSLWWLGGVTLLPLFIYGLIRPGSIAFIPLLVGYVALGSAAAFLASRFKRTLST